MNAVPRIVLLAAAATLIAGCGNNATQQSSPNPSSGANGSSYYQEGYSSGTSGLARNDYGVDHANTGATVAEMEHDACSRALHNEHNYGLALLPNPSAQDDYMTGCLKAFADHPPSGKAKPGPLNPYR
jgi:hypothetical protein